MRKKIKVEELCIGMYLHGMDTSWINTPFFKNRFMIKNEKQINKIKNIEPGYVYIDTEKGKDVLKKENIIENDNHPPCERYNILVQSEYSQRDLEGWAQKKENFLKIDKTTFLKGSFIDFNLFIKKGLKITPLVEFNNKEIEIKDSILKSGGELLIHSKDIYRYKRYLDELVKIPDCPPHYKNIIIKENANIYIKELFNDPRNPEKMKACKGTVEGIIDGILSNEGVVADFLTLDKLDYYTSIHSVNVCVLSVGVATALGIKKEKELLSIGLGSFLHDIGESTISPEIINKPVERLTDIESRMMQKHVVEGNSLLKLFNSIPEDAFYPVLEHHERLSGNGYPYGLKGDEIHLSGRITAIADTYDSLTTSRQSNKSISSFEALSIIRNESEDFDMEIFREFIRMLAR